MSIRAPHLLIIDDDEELAEILSLMLETEGYRVSLAYSSAQALQRLHEHNFSLALLDLRLGEEDGLDLLPRIRELSPNLPILMITAHGDVESAVEAFKLGATGYIRKPFEEGVLKSQIAEAIESRQLQTAITTAQDPPSTQTIRTIFRSRDPAMEATLNRITMAAQVNSNVVIQGESGTGKELVATALHHCGSRRTGPFVALNCAALPETLLESELFGHAKGAYTDAKEAKPGLFVRACGGTVFLDEIGDAPLSIQSKLLRVLQEREVLPLGGRAPVKIDVRIVAATHRNLFNLVSEGRFRQDLYYRLQVIPIHVLPLRERKRDILYLGTLFASRLATDLGYKFDGFAPTACSALEAHSWPGNVRELQNRIEHALVIGQGGIISARLLFPELTESEIQPEPISTPKPIIDGSNDQTDLVPFKQAKRIFEKNYLKQVLKEANGNIARASRLAAKSRAELYGLLKKYDLEPQAFKD